VPRSWWRVPGEKIGSGFRIFFGLLAIPLVVLVALELFAYVAVVVVIGIVGLGLGWVLSGNVKRS